MYDPNQDTYIIRSESVFYYIVTVGVLLYFSLFWVAAFYAYFGISMVWDDEGDNELEDEMVEFESVMISDSSITEILGYEFDTEDLDSYIETVTEDIVFSNDYPLVLIYKKEFDEIYLSNNISKFKNLHLYYKQKKYYTSKKQAKNLSFLKIQTKIDLDSLKLQLINKARLDPSDYAEFKKIFIRNKINTDFILSTYIASGLYPATDYDFDLFTRNLAK